MWCAARRARSCATTYLLTGAKHTLRAGDQELFHQIIIKYKSIYIIRFFAVSYRGYEFEFDQISL